MAKEPSLMPCRPDRGLESLTAVRVPEKNAEVLA